MIRHEFMPALRISALLRQPEELRRAAEGAGLAVSDVTGMVYDLLADEWHLSGDTEVNYFATAQRPG